MLNKIGKLAVVIVTYQAIQYLAFTSTAKQIAPDHPEVAEALEGFSDAQNDIISNRAWLKLRYADLKTSVNRALAG